MKEKDSIRMYNKIIYKINNKTPLTLGIFSYIAKKITSTNIFAKKTKNELSVEARTIVQRGT